MKTEVFADIKGRKLGIYISINHRQEIYPSKGKDAKVAITTEEILLVF